MGFQQHQKAITKSYQRMMVGGPFAISNLTTFSSCLDVELLRV